MKRPTPETDAVRAYEGNWDTKALRMTAHARKLERERDEAIADRDILRIDAQREAEHHDRMVGELERVYQERDEAREEAGHWKTEYEIVVDRLRGRKHPRDNGIIADDEIIPKLERERDEAREKIKRQASRICELEGATNHAGGIKKDLQENLVFGTPETDAMVERWQNSHIPADFSRRMETERNEARRLADTRLTQLLAITSSEPKDYLGLVVACRVHKDHIAQLIKERDEGREALADWENAADHVEANRPDEVHCGCVPVLRKLLADARKERDEAIADYQRVYKERDEAREEINRYREKLDLLPISRNEKPSNGIVDYFENDRHNYR